MRYDVQRWLQPQSTTLNMEDESCVSTVIDNAQTLDRQAFHQADHSVGNYRQMLQLEHQDYVLAPYLSALITSKAVDKSADSDVVAMVSM